MFRIFFDPKLGRFIIQVKGYGFFWRTVMSYKDGDNLTSVKLFETFDQAMDHVKVIGLNKLYRDGSANKFIEFINGGHHEQYAQVEA